MSDLSLLAAFHFIRPWWLLALIPLAFSVWRLRLKRDRSEQWQQNIAPHLLKALTVGGEHTRWLSPLNVSALAILIAVIAVAGPSWERKPLPFVQDESPLVVVLSLAESMNQTDVQPSRLKRAQQKISDLLELRKGSKAAVIAYAGTAHIAIPLTTDPDIVFQFLHALNTEMMPAEGSVPEKSIPLIDSVIGSDSPPATVLLITDAGSTNAASAFAAYLKGTPHQLIVYGIGAEGRSSSDNSVANAESVTLPFNKRSLETLADASGGAYVQVSVNKDDIATINNRVEQHLALVDDDNRPWVDAGYYLLYPFSVLFLFWFRKGWTLQWCAFLVLSWSLQVPTLQADELERDRVTATQSHVESVNAKETLFERAWSGFLGLWFTPDQLGRIYFDLGSYNKAARSFDNIRWKASAYYYAENFKNSIQLYSGLEAPDDLFNLGNAYAQNQEYIKALETYEALLELDPNYQRVNKNIEIVQAIVDEINLMSANQQPESGEDIGELGDEPQRADGAERQEVPDFERKQLSAEQILSDERIQEQWMKQIQQDPSRFLRVKFQMQLSQQGGEG
jgi:Ca-activated chloride channel homolog